MLSTIFQMMIVVPLCIIAIAGVSYYHPYYLFIVLPMVGLYAYLMTIGIREDINTYHQIRRLNERVLAGDIGLTERVT